VKRQAHLWDSVAERTETSARKRQNSLVLGGLELKRRRCRDYPLHDHYSHVTYVGLWRWPFRSNRLSQVHATCLCHLAAESFSHVYAWAFTLSKRSAERQNTCQQGRCHGRRRCKVTLTILNNVPRRRPAPRVFTNAPFGVTAHPSRWIIALRFQPRFIIILTTLRRRAGQWLLAGTSSS